jgi:hypothetical protein
MNSSTDKNEYYRLYRQKKGDHLRNLEKNKYWKKKGLTDEEIEKYGEYAGEVYKIKVIIKNLKAIAPHLPIDLLDLNTP